MSEETTVHKLDHTGKEVISYRGILLESTSASMTIQARFQHEDVQVSGLHIQRGDRFVERFYTNRWYNIFAIYDSETDLLKGWYCNITRPARIEGDQVYADDLALDVIVFPDGRWLVTDEEEFAGLDLTLAERRSALQAVTEIQAMVVRKQGPFSEISERGWPGRAGL
jgi:protein associated with RNAse G/E